MLASLHKGFTVAEVEQTAAYAREAGLPMLWTFLFGGPGETQDTVRETLHFLETSLDQTTGPCAPSASASTPAPT